MPETWNLFAARDILLGGLAAVGFLAVIFTVSRASLQRRSTRACS